MERATTPARDPRPSTTDLLSWPDAPPTDSAFTVSANTSRYNARTHQPIDGISKTLYGGQINEEESESLNQRKPCSGYKLKDNTGSKIFAADGEDSVPDSASSDFYSSNRTAVRIVQQVTNGISQISFSAEEDVSPKKPTTLPAGAKQRELSGTQGDPYCTNKVHFSDAKCKELIGHDIFGPPPEVPPRSAARTLESKVSKVVEEPPAPRNVHTSVRVSNPAGGQSNILFSEEPVVKTTKKIHKQKFAELTGNDIFKGDVPPGSAEKPPSLKQKEMSGSNIFADGKAASRDYYQRGVRKPPGGESSITLN